VQYKSYVKYFDNSKQADKNTKSKLTKSSISLLQKQIADIQWIS